MKKKRLRPPATGPAPARTSNTGRRAAFRFGFSAVVASFVVLGLLILGAMFQEEYEEGFVRLVSYAVRLASPEELAEAEAAGSPPPPLPVTRPDTPVAMSGGPLVDEGEMRSGQILLPAPETLIPIDDVVAKTSEALELAFPGNAEGDSELAGNKSAETD